MDKTKEEALPTAPAGTRPAARFTGSGRLSVGISSSMAKNGLTNYSVRREKSYKGEGS